MTYEAQKSGSFDTTFIDPYTLRIVTPSTYSRNHYCEIKLPAGKLHVALNNGMCEKSLTLNIERKIRKIEFLLIIPIEDCDTGCEDNLQGDGQHSPSSNRNSRTNQPSISDATINPTEDLKVVDIENDVQSSTYNQDKQQSQSVINHAMASPNMDLGSIDIENGLYSSTPPSSPSVKSVMSTPNSPCRISSIQSTIPDSLKYVPYHPPMNAPVKCFVCPKTYSSKGNAVRHMKKSHSLIILTENITHMKNLNDLEETNSDMSS